jgi:hypothetical protein
MVINLSNYVPTDGFFGAPYIDEDTEIDSPVPHRMIHGGFEGTDTRFRFHFPPKDAGYQGRMFNPLSGANGGTEDFFTTPLGEAIGGLSTCVRLGGYMVQSNQGHIGDELDPKGGDDPTLYGWRASAEAARLSKYVAAQVYGQPPHHSYVFGGSGGARRSPLCLENAPDAWDAALPFMGSGAVDDFPTTAHTRQAQTMAFSSMFNVQRLLGPKLDDVADAMAPGGSGDPFAGLDTHQREELANLYRLGFPRGDEVMIGLPMGQIWVWSSFAARVSAEDPYFEDFWTKPGFVGHDQPELLAGDLLDTTATITRVLTAQDILDDPTFDQAQYQVLRGRLQNMAAMAARASLPCVIEVRDLGAGYRLGAGVRVASGRAAGRQLYCINSAGAYLFCDGMGEASNLRFTDVLAGDDVHLDNHAFLAYCYFYRHHLFDEPRFDFLRVDGHPVFDQFPPMEASPLMGVPYTGHYQGKLMWVHHTHDASLWPASGMAYRTAVMRSQGEEGMRLRFRQRWVDNAEHVPPAALPSKPGRATNTWLVNYQPFIEQSLVDLVAWVEKGIDPVETAFEYLDGKVTLPPTAAERKGIQPVVHATANGARRAEVRVGEPVTLAVDAEVPSGAGTIIAVAWDFDGSGTYPFSHDGIDGSGSSVSLTTTYSYDRPGEYFATALVHSQREGDVNAAFRRIPNLSQVRVVVT